MILSTIAILAAALGQAVTKADDKLDYMKGRAAAYRLVKEGDSGQSVPLVLRDEPAFRLGRQPADDILEGAIFLWVDDDGRPEAALQLFLIQNARESRGLWIHEFISLSRGPLSGSLRNAASWSPRTPGVEDHAMPEAPRPAGSATQRLRQMRSIAQEFRITDKFKEKTWDELRFLPTPVARYGGKAGSKVIDGALFAFATGTDPEAFLFVEAIEGPDGPRWHYALAPMTCFDLKATRAGKEVWDLPFRREAHDPARPYFVLTEAP